MEEVVLVNKVEHITLNKRINISKGINVFFGPNGTGKSTLTKFISKEIMKQEKNNQERIVSVISKHIDQSSFIGNKKTITISPSIVNLREKQGKLKELNKYFKYNKKWDMGINEYRGLFKDIPFENIEKVYEEHSIYSHRFNYADIMDKYDSINDLKLKLEENKKIQYSLDKMREKHSLLESLVDDEEVIECPLCKSKEKKSIDIIVDMIENSLERERELMNELDETIEDIGARDIEDIDNLLKVFELSKGQLRTVVHSLNSATPLDEIVECHNEIIELETAIKEIENEQKEWIKIFKDNGYFIENEVKNFDEKLIKDCKFDDLKITITLSRLISTLSQGELNMLLHIIKLIEFKLNPKAEWLILDDPFSSNDSSKMPTISTYINNVIKNDDSQGVIIFTHSQDFYDCIKSKVHYRKKEHNQKLSFRLIDKLDSKLTMYNDSNSQKSMIYNAYKSKKYRKFTQAFIDRDREVQIKGVLSKKHINLLHTDKKTDSVNKVIKERELDKLLIKDVKNSTHLIIWKMMKASKIRLSLECLLNEYADIQGNISAKTVGGKIREISLINDSLKTDLHSMAGLSNNMIHGFGTSTSFSSALSTSIDELNRKQEKINIWIQEKIWK